MPALRDCLITSVTIHGANALALAEDSASRLTTATLLLKRYLYKYSDKDDPQLEQRFCVLGRDALRIVPIENATNRLMPMGLLFYEVLGLVHAQANLSTSSIYLAGVLTDGLVLDDHQLMVGPGIAKAQALTNPWARVPRVVVDPALLRRLDEEPLLRNDTHDGKDERLFIRKLVRRDSDGMYYVDYLQGMESESDAPEQYGEFLKLHRDQLVEQLQTMRPQGERSLRLSWLRRYHNETIRRLFKARAESVTKKKQLQTLSLGGHSQEELRVPRVGPLIYPF